MTTIIEPSRARIPIAPRMPRASVVKSTAPLPLEAGDHLTRREFERRYAAMPHLKKAELIEGVVYMPSPVHCESHAEPHSDIMTWLGVYRAATSGVRLADNATVRLDIDNEVQPDALLRLSPTVGGHSHVSADDYIDGAPELIVEVASSSASYDMHDKLKVYRRNGVQEYLVWLIHEQKFVWLSLDEGEYTLLLPDEQGVIHSRAFPGLRLAVDALLSSDLTAVLAELQQGLNSPEHAAFTARLAQSESG